MSSGFEYICYENPHINCRTNRKESISDSYGKYHFNFTLTLLRNYI